jgi:exoribonuclease R
MRTQYEPTPARHQADGAPVSTSSNFGETVQSGHFGLAVRQYSHSTAPNRRYPDLITQRLLKAATAGRSSPYEADELEALAKHCTEEEDAANKVERQVGKSAAAMLLESRIGERFDAIVTGASAKGTWIRLLHPPLKEDWLAVLKAWTSAAVSACS